jgi:hypothetical protein
VNKKYCIYDLREMRNVSTQLGRSKEWLQDFEAQSNFSFRRVELFRGKGFTEVTMVMWLMY